MNHQELALSITHCIDCISVTFVIFTLRNPATGVNYWSFAGTEHHCVVD